MLDLFNRNKVLLDEDIIEWIFNTYTWAFNQFDRKVFVEETILVVPDNKHFPGKETTEQGMANLIFSQVKQYAGMAHWPTRLYNLADQSNQAPIQRPIQVSGTLRGKQAVASFLPLEVPQASMPQSTMPQSTMPQSSMPNDIAILNEGQNSTAESYIVFSYHTQQLKNPAGLIAHLAHGLSSQLVSVATTPVPGGQDYLPMAGELIGVFMGFGLMFANSATASRGGGCGSCGVAGPVRQVFLSEQELTYALAVFCHLKGIKSRNATTHLKPHLRGFFRDSIKDCKKRIKGHEQLKHCLSDDSDEKNKKMA